LLNNIYLF
jgi:hypothetical protein